MTKYIPTSITDFDNIILLIKDELEQIDKANSLNNFIDYYEENCSQPYALIDKNLKLIWESPEDERIKHTCTINTEDGIITLKPILGKGSRTKISKDLVKDILKIIRAWDLGIKSEKEEIDESTTPKIDTVTIKGNPNAETIAMPNELLFYFTRKDKDCGSWYMTANYQERRGVYLDNDYKKKFITAEESIIDIIKEIIIVRDSEVFKPQSIENKDGKAYTIDELEQLAYKYLQRQESTNSTTITTPFYAPDSDEDKASYIEAIKQGYIDIVQQFLKAGARADKDIKVKTKKFDLFDTAIENKQTEVATLLLKHTEQIGEKVYDWQYEEIEKIKNRF